MVDEAVGNANTTVIKAEYKDEPKESASVQKADEDKVDNATDVIKKGGNGGDDEKPRRGELLLYEGHSGNAFIQETRNTYTAY